MEMSPLESSGLVRAPYCSMKTRSLNGSYRRKAPISSSTALQFRKRHKHVKNAELFINYVLRPDISAKISEAFPYLNPNIAARELLTPAQRNNPASFPTADQLASMQTFKDVGEQATKIDELVTSLKAQ